MYLKALELSGFKSFANKTFVEFNKGITSIVGPNGSGKSNILDAILWVLGEQSYKNIRAKESSDVIFSGGKNKKAKSMAEVSLIIDNEDKYLDIEFSEVKITRRIFKSGENEYLINNNKVRLKDINNLFMDTGIGKQAYSIIGQGRVERIISSNPKELKEIIEEAAGVKRAKFEKEDSLKKLKEVKNEIEKIEYLEKELSSRVAILKEESLKSRLYKTYTEKMNINKYMLLEYNINERRELQKDFKKEKNNIEIKLNKTKVEFDEKKNELQYSNDKKEKNYNNLKIEKNNSLNFFKEIENIKNENNELNKKYSNLEIEASEKQKRKVVLENEILRKNEILKNSKLELDGIITEFEEKEKEKEKLEKTVSELKLKKDKILFLLKEKNEKNQNFEVDKIRLLHENQDLEKRIFTTENENKRFILELEKENKNFINLSKEKEIIEKESEKQKFQKQKNELEINQFLKELENLERDFLEKNKYKNNLSFEYENLSSKKRAYENIIENNETFAKSIKYILNEKIDGVVGAFINLIDIPNGFEQSFQTLSGAMFQDIVVENSKIGEKCINILKEKKLGRASFLPIDSVKIYKILEKLPEEKGIIDFARNIINYDKKIEKIVQFVYGNSIVVENLEVGTKLLKNGFSDRIVTLDGDIITSRGRMTGGFLQKGKDELIERKRELKEIIQNLNKIKEKGKLVNIQINELKEKIELSENKKNEKMKEFSNFNEKNLQFLKEYNNFNLEFNRKKREVETLNYEINENKKIITLRKNKIIENEKIINNIESMILENKEKIENLNIEIEKIEDLTIFEQQLNQIERSYEILKLKTENNKTRYFEIEEDYNKLINENKEILEFEKRRDVLKKKFENEILEKQNQIQDREQKNEILNEKIKNLEENIKELEKLEKILIIEVKDIEMKMIEFQNEYEKITEKLVKNEKDLQFFENEIVEFLNQNINKSEEYIKIEDEITFNQTKRKLAMYEKSRAEIGVVNLSSIEEYEKENARYTEIVDQKQDLVKSGEALMNLIKNIENEIVEKFNNAFIQINKNFEYMCNTILNGAKGTLRLIDEENLLETGLELSVKYKNKAEQTLLLLSGGEKSMLAVSFIMAIFMFKPSPFTFFDEIEAALDEENTKKIVKLLNKFIEKSQFILITHNKETMKGSHRLYGVTMNKEIGESRLVSVDM